MVEPLHWRLRTAEIPPFEYGGRQLRVTVYCPNPELSEAEALALGIVRELAYRDTLRIVDIDPAAPWQIAIDPPNHAEDVGTIRLTGPGGQREHWALHVRPWSVEAAALLRTQDVNDADVRRLLPHVAIIEGHRQANRDVFITAVPDILALRPQLPTVNARPPTEGLKIIGLYLRSIDDFTFRSWESGPDKFDRGHFYWVLARQRLPSMWRYFHACVLRASLVHDTSDHLGGAILNRCVRALQARDEVGFRFYQRQRNSTRDGILYHFEYLLLLLSGALDAQARVARSVYKIARPGPRTTSFRKEEFRGALRDAGATDLVRLLEDRRFLAFQTLLSALRNAVHSTGLPSAALVRNDQAESSIVRVLEDAENVVKAATELGLTDELGMAGHAGITLEPYECACVLTSLGLSYVDAIAGATQVENWLPGKTVLSSGPPPDRGFQLDFRSRIDAMG